MSPLFPDGDPYDVPRKDPEPHDPELLARALEFMLLSGKVEILTKALREIAEQQTEEPEQDCLHQYDYVAAQQYGWEDAWHEAGKIARRAIEDADKIDEITK